MNENENEQKTNFEINLMSIVWYSINGHKTGCCCCCCFSSIIKIPRVVDLKYHIIQFANVSFLKVFNEKNYKKE